MTRSRAVLAPLIAGFLVIGTTLAFAGCGGGDEASQSGQDKAVAEAKAAFQQAQKSGANLSVGPCIAENLPGLPDWVADIAHDPREDVDDQAENQCQRYRDGEADHFVELTPQGQLIRAE